MYILDWLVGMHATLVFRSQCNILNFWPAYGLSMQLRDQPKTCTEHQNSGSVRLDLENRRDKRYMVCGFMYICVVTFFVWFWYKCDHLISFGLYGYEYEQFNFLEIFLISFGLYVGTKTDRTPMVIYKYEYIYLSLLGFKFGYE